MAEEKALMAVNHLKDIMVRVERKLDDSIEDNKQARKDDQRAWKETWEETHKMALENKAEIEKYKNRTFGMFIGSGLGGGGVGAALMKLFFS